LLLNQCADGSPAAITLPGYWLELSCHLLDGRCPGARCYSFDIAKGDCVFVSGMATQHGTYGGLGRARPPNM
jgi:hypothetical protein